MQNSIRGNNVVNWTLLSLWYFYLLELSSRSYPMMTREMRSWGHHVCSQWKQRCGDEKFKLVRKMHERNWKKPKIQNKNETTPHTTRTCTHTRAQSVIERDRQKPRVWLFVPNKLNIWFEIWRQLSAKHETLMVILIVNWQTTRSKLPEVPCKGKKIWVGALGKIVPQPISCDIFLLVYACANFNSRLFWNDNKIVLNWSNFFFFFALKSSGKNKNQFNLLYFMNHEYGADISC